MNQSINVMRLRNKKVINKKILKSDLKASKYDNDTTTSGLNNNNFTKFRQHVEDDALVNESISEEEYGMVNENESIEANESISEEEYGMVNEMIV